MAEHTQGLRAQTPQVPILFPSVQGHPAPIGMQFMPLANSQLPYREPTPPPEHFPPPVAAPVSDEEEPHEVLVERVREVVPDVLPAHVFNLLDQHKATFSRNLLDAVIHLLLEDPSYPRDLKGKGKTRAAKDNALENPVDVNTGIDYAKFDANRSRGPVYRGLCLVRLGWLPTAALLADL